MGEGIPRITQKLTVESKPQVSISPSGRVKGVETVSVSYNFPYTNENTSRVICVFLDQTVLWCGKVGQSGSVSVVYDFSKLSPGVHRLWVQAACSGTVGGGGAVNTESLIYKDPDDLGPKCPKIGEPIDIGSGNMWLQHTDVSFPGPLPLTLTRTYNSKILTSGAFGIGWSHTYETSLQPFGPNGYRLMLGDGSVEYYVDNDGDGTYETMLPRDLGTTFKKTQGGFVRTTKEGVRWEFDTYSRLVVVRDRNGNAVTLARDSSGRIAAVTDGVGRMIAIGYNSLGQASTVTLPDGKAFAYTYYQGRIATVTDPEGAVTTYQYDTYGQLAKVLDANGHVMEAHTYDSKGRAITSEKDGGNEKVTISYVDDATTKVTNSKSEVTTYTLDKNAGRTKISQAAGSGCTSCGIANASYTYDANAQNKITTFEYDAKGNLAKKTETGLLGSGAPYAYATAYTHTANGQIASIDGPRTDASDVTTFSYYPVTAGDPDSGQL
ncbi:MAG: RHS repeat protein, partial [Nitrospirae bacterium]|nr:RHS repeat protein [Nitrospirota bacterium]